MRRFVAPLVLTAVLPAILDCRPAALRQAARTPEEAVRAFLAAAAAGDCAAAHAYLAAALRARQPLAAFTSTVKANATFFDVVEVLLAESAGEKGEVRLSGVLVLRSGQRMKGSFELVEEQGGWKLRSYWFRA